MVEPDTNPRHRLDPKALEMLVCPLTKTALVYDAEAGAVGGSGRAHFHGGAPRLSDHAGRAPAQP